MNRSCGCGCGHTLPEDMRADARYLRGHRQRAHAARHRSPAAEFWESARTVRRRRPARRA